MLTIGVPVFNGERFMGDALDSLLSQTHDDFEIVVADNCSTDRTEEIARDYVRQDSRVSYIRRAENIGAAANYNALAVEARTPLFKWAAADDLHAPTFLERCLELLAADPGSVGASTRTIRINDRSEVVASEDYRLRTDSDAAHIRFRDTIARQHSCFSIFGVFRTDVLLDTRLIRPHGHGDRLLLAELVLRGRMLEHPAYLLSRRLHDDSFSSGTPTDDEDPERFWTGSQVEAPTPQQSIDDLYRDLVAQSPLSDAERRRCEFEVTLRQFRKTAARRLFRPLRRQALRVRTRLDNAR